MDNKKMLGNRINTALAMRDKKQKELAHAIQVTDNTISYFCSGKRTPNLQQIIAIAKELDVSTDYLLGLSGTPSIDEDIQVACKTVGLTETAINEIKASRGWGLDVLNCFLENSDFFSLLLEVQRLAIAKYRLKIAETDLMETDDDRYAKTVIELTEKRIVREYWAVEKFKEVQKAVVDKLISSKEFQKWADMIDKPTKKEFNKEGTENNGKH